MNTTKRITAGLAAVIMGCSAVGRIPLCKQNADAKAPSVREFAESVLPQLPIQNDTGFASLCCTRNGRQLLHDGKPASGNSFAGFRVIDGELKIAASETVRAGETAEQEYLSLEEAATRIGLEIHETKDGVTVSSPFRSGTLIVKSAELPDTKGASELGGWNNLHVLQYPTAADSYAAYQEYQDDAAVIYAEPNRTYHITEDSDEYQFPADNWGWPAIGADGFMKKHAEDTASAPEVVAAVIDTGIYSEHEMFKDRIAAGGASFIPENNCSYEDLNGHGTHCSGIICGMSPDNVKILPLKGLNAEGSGETLGLYCAMMYAAEQNADVVSMSFGGDGCSPMFEEAIKVLKDKGIPSVVAAGNSADDAAHYSPANIPDAFTVSSVSDERDRYYYDEDDPIPDLNTSGFPLSYFSNFGDRIDFAAPGDSIESASNYAPFDYVSMSGTSMACPHVTGCVADILTLRPDYSAEDVYDCLKMNATDLGDAGFDTSYGWGMVNISNLDLHASSLPAPEATCASGRYEDPFTVVLRTAEPDAEIRYTLDGSIPEADTGILYQGEELLIERTTELTAVTVKDGDRSSSARWHYEFYVEEPKLDYQSGQYYSPIVVNILNYPAYPEDYILLYSLNGFEPTPVNGKLYDPDSGIMIKKTAKLKISVVRGDTVLETFTYGYQIGDEASPDLFEIENGVLTHYYGYAQTLDLNDCFQPGELTKIGDGAFRKNEELINITLPESVKTIGKNAFEEAGSLCGVYAPGVETVETNAFRYCSRINRLRLPALKYIRAGAFLLALDNNYEQNPFGDDNLIEEIDSQAFEGSGLVYAAFPHLKKLGENAFAYNYNLQTMVLPDSIKALPFGTLLLCESLTSLDAPGVTELGDWALCLNADQKASLEHCTIDLTRLTSIGTNTLSMLKKPGRIPSLTFDSLTKISEDSFADFPVGEIYLPALKDIPANAFLNADCSVFYLENAERLKRGALDINPVWGREIAFVFGDHVLKNQINPLEKDSGQIIAAPEGSPMQQYAKSTGTTFFTTPDILFPSAFENVSQYNTVSLDTCIRLAFGCKLRFTAEEAVYDSGYQAPAEPFYSDDAGERFFLDTSAPGTVTLRADLTDSSGAVLKSKTQEIRITSAADTNFMTGEGVKIVIWEEGEMHAGVSESIFFLPPVYCRYDFKFKPETDGEYYFIPEVTQMSVSVYNSRDELINQTANDYSLRDTLSGLKPVTLKAGEIYTVLAETRNHDTINNRCAGVLISKQRPTRCDEYNGSIGPDMRFYEKGREEPVLSEMTVTDPDYSDEEGNPLLLEENTDYQMFRYNRGNSGIIFTFYKGDLFGTRMDQFCFYEDYTPGQTVPVPSVQKGETLCYHISPTENLTNFLVSMNYTDAYLQKFISGEAAEEPYSTPIVYTLTDSNGNMIFSDDSGYTIIGGEIYQLYGGCDYYLMINVSVSSNAAENEKLPAGMFELYSTTADANHWIDKCQADSCEYRCYTGKSMDFVRVTTPDGTALEEGKDYQVYMQNRIIPGTETLLIKGIGEYFGSHVMQIEITQSYLSEAELAPEQIALNEPFEVSGDNGFFELNADTFCTCKLRRTDESASGLYQYSVYRYDEDSLMWEEAYSRSSAKDDVMLKLNPGIYHIYLAQKTAHQQYILEASDLRPGIGKAEVHAAPLVETGEELMPEITLTFDGKTLTEGTDYIISYPDIPIRESGVYSLTITGNGSFTGERTAYIVVEKQDAEMLPKAKNDDNTLTVTKPGETAVCEWIPNAETYGIRMNELMLSSLVIYDLETNAEVCRLKGYGYLSDIFAVTPGKKYLICASRMSPEQTGDIRFTLVPDCVDLRKCTVEGASQILYAEENALPEFTVKNGETVLQRDTDYTVYFSGGDKEPGHAVISLTGKGRYVGELRTYYYVCPVLDPEAFDADESKTALTLNDETTQYVMQCGNIQKFDFTAPEDGSYRIGRPDPVESGICVFVYGPDGKLLAQEAENVQMKSGEKLRFFAVSEHLEDRLSQYSKYILAVYSGTAVTELRVNDNVYLVYDGAAYLERYEGESTGILIPAAIHDPEHDTDIPVAGIAQEMYETLEDKTIYFDAETTLYQALTETGMCTALTEPQTGIKGDISGDGSIDRNDLLTLFRCMAERQGMVINEAVMSAADMNEDGCLDLTDAELLKATIEE